MPTIPTTCMANATIQITIESSLVWNTSRTYRPSMSTERQDKCVYELLMPHEQQMWGSHHKDYVDALDEE